MSHKTMSSRERVMAALNHREPDRIPKDLGGTQTSTIHFDAHANLKRYLGLTGGLEAVDVISSQAAVIDPRIMDRFGFDCVSVRTKPPGSWKLNISTDEKGYRKYTDEWGVVRACPEGGYYFDIVKNPLPEATIADLDRYPWPDPMDPGRFQGLADKARALYEGTDKCMILSTGVSLFAHIAYLIGWEEFYVSLIANPPLIRGFVERLIDFYSRVITSALDLVGPYVQVLYLSDDLTHQGNLFVGKQVLNDLFMPGYRKLIQTAKGKADLKVLFHICGASHLVFEELISVGVDAVNPVQVSAAGMDDTASLKERFGNRLTFWGAGCDTQHVLPRGTTEEVRREVRRRIADLAPGGGFVFCPVHNIQRDVPPENIVALFDEAIRYGHYPIRTED